MTFRAKILLSLIAVAASILVLFQLYRSHQAAELARGRILADDPEQKQREIKRLPEPVILLVLDTSSSLRSQGRRAGNDPENREVEAVEALLRLAHHFSSPKEGGFAPRIGVLTFGASPKWLKINETCIWEVRTAESLEIAIDKLYGVTGGKDDEDRRHGSYTDFNGALLATLEVLEGLPPNARPMVLMMTDGQFSPYAGHSWNYGETAPFDLKDLHAELRDKTLRCLDRVRSQLPQSLYESLTRRMRDLDYEKEEPYEYIQQLPILDEEFARELAAPGARDAFQYAVSTVLGAFLHEEKWSEDAQREGEVQLFQRYLPQLGQRVALEVIGLSPLTFQQIEDLPPDRPPRRMLDDLQRMATAAGSDRSRLRWCSDAGLLREFLGVFEQWLRLLRRETTLADNDVFEIGGHVESLALYIEARPENGGSVAVVGPGNIPFPPMFSRSGKHLFLIKQPRPGKYHITGEASKLEGEVLGLIQTNPLFEMVATSDRVRLGSPPPSPRIVAFSTESGNRVPLQQVFAKVPSVLNGQLLSADGQLMRTISFTPQSADSNTISDFRLNLDFWTGEIVSRPGRYRVEAEVKGLEYRDGSSVTPQGLSFEFENEPGMRITVHDAEGYQRRDLGFPWRWVHLVGGWK